jgi:predicted Ser/Thr protein kinase
MSTDQVEQQIQVSPDRGKGQRQSIPNFVFRPWAERELWCEYSRRLKGSSNQRR